MPEITIIAINLVALAIAYLYLYPEFAGNSVNRMAVLDTAVGASVLVLVAPFNWGSPSNYSFFTFELSWWFFTIASYALLEIPLFFFYLKARGLGSQYLQAFKISSAGRKNVEKLLVDTKWDGLRTRSALRFLVIASNLGILSGAVFLYFVEDNIYASYAMIHLVLILVFWALLRQAVRLIPDAPSDLLDERMLKERNSIYFTAFQRLGTIVTILLIAFMLYLLVTDARSDSDGFTYSLSFTWPQAQALFGFVYGYTFMLPSMIMAWRESKRTVHQ